MKSSPGTAIDVQVGVIGSIALLILFDILFDGNRSTARLIRMSGKKDARHILARFGIDYDKEHAGSSPSDEESRPSDIDQPPCRRGDFKHIS